jgi:CheY-like chemotaxis protein
MSHELRTPLNSILILAQQLAENPESNLTGRQVEFSRTIHGAGTDLLNLISDILDLSKIESGTVSVEVEEILFQNFAESVARPFRHEADTRKLSFDVNVDPYLPSSIASDSKRLQQVLKNLLSNAFKFTEHGGIRFSVRRVHEGWSPDKAVLRQADGVVAFEVSDTGIGIAPEKQKIIFEAFQQADSSTSRRYGGTGLGLAISRELAALLGGEIQLQSTPNVGSTFTLYLPQKFVAAPGARGEADTVPQFPIRQGAGRIRSATRPVQAVADDRAGIEPGDKTMLIVEDDPAYAGALADLARDNDLKAIVAATGAEALALAREHRPTAISLDIFLPDMLGWTVLSLLKQDPDLRHIPVQVVTIDEDRQHGLTRGAFQHLAKPASAQELGAAVGRIKDYAEQTRRRLLIVEDDPAEQTSIVQLLDHEDVDITVVGTGQDALSALRRSSYDCVVLDLRLPDMSGFDLLERLHTELGKTDAPIVVFTGKDLSPEEDSAIRTFARSIVVKGVESPERLLDETALFLHRVIADLPPAKRAMLERLRSSDEMLAGRTALLVDDDARNIFALGSVLERLGMKTLSATTGKEALDIMSNRNDVAIVLMDIMMPEMDGYETIHAIREDLGYARLPIIALTAKAMKGDREKCLEAGASDYLAKPVNTAQLLSALRMWLHR